jgi:hypothetical protein
VFDAPTTKRGMVRGHGGLIADIAFQSVRGQTLLATVSLDGRLSISHVLAPTASDADAAASAAQSDLTVRTVVTLQLGDEYGPPPVEGVEGGAYRPLLAWRPGRAELLVATRVYLLRLDAVALMCKPGDVNVPEACTPGTSMAGALLTTARWLQR